jgi:hypothetical protein
MSKRNNFAGLSERRIQGQVGLFGEHLITNLFGGTHVANDYDYPFADVIVEGQCLAIEVKMSNLRHGIRILPEQSLRLLKEVENGFIFTKGLYACACYNGVYGDKTRKGKSMIWSRRFTEGHRRAIIAKEMRHIFLIEIDFLQYWTEKDSSLLKKGCIVSSEGKSGRDSAIELGRRKLLGFLSKSPQRTLLSEKYGTNKWTVSSEQIEFCFTNTISSTKITLPVHYIGSRNTGAIVKKLITSEHAPIQLDFDNRLL